MIVKKISCDNNREYLRLNKCRVKPISRGVYKIWINYTYLKSVEELWVKPWRLTAWYPSKFWFQVHIQTFKKNSFEFKPFVIDVRTVSCKKGNYNILFGVFKLPVFKKILSAIYNVRTGCDCPMKVLEHVLIL